MDPHRFWSVRRKAKQEAIRKKKDFKVIPGHLLPPATGQPPGMGSSTSSTHGGPGTGGTGSAFGHVSVADAIASLEGSKSATYPGTSGDDVCLR